METITRILISSNSAAGVSRANRVPITSIYPVSSLGPVFVLTLSSFWTAHSGHICLAQVLAML